MADEDEDEDNQAEGAPGPSVVKWAVAGGVAIFLAVLGAQLAAPVLTRMLYGDPNAPVEEVAVDAADAAADAAVDSRPVDYASLDPAIYVPLDPPLLANFEDDRGATRYLQLSLQAMGRDQEEMDAVRQHAPAIRNAFLFLMSTLSFADISSVEGKEKLRAEMLQEAQAILVRNTGKPGIEEIYFTSFVIQ
jgi:flagellar protein FliL